jgi:hypothetical protein
VQSIVNPDSRLRIPPTIGGPAGICAKDRLYRDGGLSPRNVTRTRRASHEDPTTSSVTFCSTHNVLTLGAQSEYQVVRAHCRCYRNNGDLLESFVGLWRSDGSGRRGERCDDAKHVLESSSEGRK